jgi:predicted O-methyltransferase YrrM
VLRKLSLLLRYIRYTYHAVNAHSIHSPFVFDLYTRCIKSRTDENASNTIGSLISKMRNDNRVLTVTDYGTAEGNTGTRKLSVQYIAKNYSSSKYKAELLCRLVSYFKPRTILELGTSLGIGTTALSLGFPQAHIITLEGSAEIASAAKENFIFNGLKNIEIITGEFNSSLKNALRKLSSVDIVYIDGNHRSGPTLNYFKECLSASNENTVFIFDDIHWSADMEEAWDKIKQHDSVTVTVDLFTVGLVFLKPGIARQHFTLK